MAEQDRYESHLGANPNNPIDGASRPRVNFDALARGSGAEQDRYASHFSINPDSILPNASRFGKGASASEQDHYGSHFSLVQLPVCLERTLLTCNKNPSNPIDPAAVGILRSTLLPSIGFHSGLAVIVYAASRAADRVDGKDWLWPTGQVLNAWWCAVGTRVVNDKISLGTAYSHLAYSEKLLLTGVTAWGARVFYRVASRSMTRSRDDPRYDAAKKKEGFWNEALFSVFLPEALFQAVISLPFTLPFRAIDDSAAASPLHVHPEYTHGLAIALFSAGFALEVLADMQLTAHRKTNSNDLDREGVWSIVRHPK
jgi:steroid 5-alpha reductase family enzyme